MYFIRKTKRYPIPLVAIIVSLLTFNLSGCSNTDTNETASVKTSDQPVVKSPEDNRSYRALTLENGLRVILVSDSTADKAAAAIDVDAGSWSNPTNRRGLAHFLEHMLFLKSEKYPTLDGYRNFIRANGGTNNAFTSSQHTNYHFEINADSLRPALDRLAQSLATPILDELYVDRERNAVDSEFRMGFKNDGWRNYITQGTTANPAHPYAKFSTGSLETLNNDDGKSLLRDLQTFYEKYYVASNMSVVVYGKETTKTLESWVRESFSNIPVGEKPDNSFQQKPFLKDQLGVRINIESLKDSTALELVFPMPSAQPYYAEKPLAYIGRLLANEGQGSLHSYLKSKGYIESLSAGGWDYSGEFSIFSINMELTEQGKSQAEEITALTFDYINLIKQKGVKKILFDETGKLAALNFRYKESDRPRDMVIDLSNNLLNYPAKHALNIDAVFNRFDPDLVNDFLGYLSPDNMRLIVSGKNLELDQKEYYYGTGYSISQLSESLLSRLAEPQTHKAMSILGQNPYIPEDLNLISEASDSDVPSQLINEPGLRLWFKKDTTFKTPKSDIRIKISNKLSAVSASNRVKLSLFNRLLQRQINEFAYPALEAGLSYSLKDTGEGLILQVSGFSHKQSLLLGKILKTLAGFSVSEEALQLEKERLKKDLDNFSLKSPDDQAYDAVYRVLFPGYYSNSIQLIALDPLEASDIEAFSERFLANAHVDVLTHGNLTESTATEIARSAQSLVTQQSAPFISSIYNLQDVPATTIQMEIDHTDSTSVLYYQADNERIETRATYALLGKLVGTDFFRELRTNQQLGYVVWAGPMRIKQRPGFVFLIQSPKLGPDKLKDRMTAFIENQLTVIAEMPDEELEKYKAGLVQDLLKKDIGLSARTRKYSRAIDAQEFDFRETERFADAVNNLTREQLVALYRKATLEKDALSIEVKSYGNNHKDADFEEAEKNQTVCRNLSCFENRSIPLT